MSSASQSGGRPRQADGREGGRQRQASARQRRLRGKSYEEQNAATDPSGDAGAAADAEQAAAPDCSVGEHHVMVEPEMHGLTTAEVEATLGWIDDAIPETSALLRAVEGCLTKFVWFGEDISRGALLEDPPAAFRSWREAAARQLQSASSMLELVQGRVRWLGDELSVFAEQFADVPEVHQQIADSIDRLNEQIESHNALASQLDELAPQVAVMDRGRPGWDPIWCQILGLALPGAATPAGGDGAGAIAGGAGSSGQAQTEGSSGQAQTEGSSGQAQTEGSSGQAQTEGSSAAAGSTPRAPTPEEDEGILAQAQELASLSDAVRSVGEGVAVLTAFVRGGYGVRDAGAILRRLLTANSDLWGRFASLASSQPDQLAHVLERLGSITGTVVNTTAVLQIVSLLVQGKRAEASAELAQLGAGLGVGAAC
ncbi:MAG: hypothetical protein FJ125_03975, partial [Deltaproteobacteria bacterium]|nr:hypothetical protein [Deltaproteobacteria bacterium]